MKTVIAAPQFAHYPEEWHLAPVLETGVFLFLSGQTGTRPDGSVSPDPETQFRDAFGSIEANLAAAGAGFADVVEMTTYHVDLRKHLDVFIKVKDEHVHAPYPAWSAIGVTELITEGTLVEIRVIARRPAS
jgi:enamine deaminase RidA (YjgF/YER057c/UK114 family)